jgi:glycosyltransferase involved in cell wall biosynthesis
MKAMPVREPDAAARPTVSVVIPAFNEERGIVGVLHRVLALQPQLAAMGVNGPEVIVVDDGSRDRTAELVQPIDGVRLVRHGENRGYGAALKAGFACARGEWVAFLDADGTYPPEALVPLCQAILDGADVAIGSRMGGEANGMPAARRFGNRVFAGLVTLLSDRRIRDCASGLRVFRRTVLPGLLPLPEGLNFTPIMTLRAVHEGLALVEIGIPYSQRIGDSKLSVVRDGLRYASSITWTALSYNPVRVLGALGLAGVGIAVVVGVGLVSLRLSGVTTLGARGVAAVFLALVAGVTGVSLFALGATFNYLVSLFRGQPVRLGLFGAPLFRRPLERHFGWAGPACTMAGVALAGGSLALGVQGWPIDRLWLYLVGSALLILVGVQLMVSWVVMGTLHELADRQRRVERDLAPPPPSGGA